MVTNAEFCNFHHPLPWKQLKMAAKQNKSFGVCVRCIVCLTNMIAETATDAYYVYFIRRIINYIVFCIFNEFGFNICINNAFFLQLKYHKTKTHCITTKSFWKKKKITIHTSTTQSFIALTLFKLSKPRLLSRPKHCGFSSKLLKTKATTNQQAIFIDNLCIINPIFDSKCIIYSIKH